MILSSLLDELLAAALVRHTGSRWIHTLLLCTTCYVHQTILGDLGLARFRRVYRDGLWRAARVPGKNCATLRINLLLMHKLHILWLYLISIGEMGDDMLRLLLLAERVLFVGGSRLW